VDWGRLPDVAAVALLTCAFASAARRSQTADSGVWLVGWFMIVLHFTAYMYDQMPGMVGTVATFIGMCALAWAGLLFTWAAVPYRNRPSSRWMLGVMVFSNTFYLTLLVFAPHAVAALNGAAILFGALPLLVSLVTLRTSNYSQRWLVVLIYGGLTAFLLAFQNQPGSGQDMAVNAVFCTVFLGACIHFCHAYWRATTGAFITIAGFFAWSMVFVVGPITRTYLPGLRLEDEVWNLPKYLVAVGMILLLLEDQIEHNKYLALHDELTGLPNRRLFQDRLGSAIERARRLGTQAAVLLVDIDHFKNVNDSFGHHIGDKVLARVGAVLSGRVRRSDTVARTGGDEFSIVLEEPTSREDAERVSNSLVELLSEPFNIDEHTVTVGASVGLAIFPDDATDSESLSIAADLRMYRDKNLSRDASDPALASKPAAGGSGERRQTSLAASE
jgi:diguanylate cyclase (GGDEF)-like protein